MKGKRARDPLQKDFEREGVLYKVQLIGYKAETQQYIKCWVGRDKVNKKFGVHVAGSALGAYTSSQFYMQRHMKKGSIMTYWTPSREVVRVVLNHLRDDWKRLELQVGVRPKSKR